MEIAQGVIGKYALVSQRCSLSLLCMFGTRHWLREKMFDPFILPKMGIEFDTSLLFVFFLVVKLLSKPF